MRATLRMAYEPSATSQSIGGHCHRLSTLPIVAGRAAGRISDAFEAG